MRYPIALSLVVVLSLAAAPAAAGVEPFQPRVEPCSADAAQARPWAVTFGGTPAVPGSASLRLAYAEAQTTPTRRVVPIEYSEAYKVRAKIHKIASIATLPLFIGTYVVGQDLYNNPGQSESKRGLHGGLASATAVLFGVNSVTGVWNLWEGRKDPSHKAKRMTHGVLMLVADAGFVATGLLAPDNEEGRYQDYTNRRSTHRTVGIASMAIATVSYVMMLFGR